MRVLDPPPLVEIAECQRCGHHAFVIVFEGEPEQVPLRKVTTSFDCGQCGERQGWQEVFRVPADGTGTASHVRFFRAAWELANSLGQCDEIYGKEYRRIFKCWWMAGSPENALGYIRHLASHVPSQDGTPEGMDGFK